MDKDEDIEEYNRILNDIDVELYQRIEDDLTIRKEHIHGDIYIYWADTTDEDYYNTLSSLEVNNTIYDEIVNKNIDHEFLKELDEKLKNEKIEPTRDELLIINYKLQTQFNALHKKYVDLKKENYLLKKDNNNKTQICIDSKKQFATNDGGYVYEFKNMTKKELEMWNEINGVRGCYRSHF